nr:MAG TPA: hypothetical protein [Caudoviricetes sp.]
MEVIYIKSIIIFLLVVGILYFILSCVEFIIKVDNIKKNLINKYKDFKGTSIILEWEDD